MSWLENVKTKLVIKTGDGKEFSPNWINASKSIDYNTTEFNFPGVPGTLVDRRERQGTRYVLEIFFQGDDHLEEAASFEASAEDKRFWTIAHPFYKDIFVQPSSLALDNTKYNVSKFTIPIMETITDTVPVTSVIPEDKIEADTETTNETIVENFENNVEPDSKDIIQMRENLDSLDANVSPSIEDSDDGESFFNKLNKAQADVNNAAAEAGQSMRSTQAAIQAPARFKQSLESRLAMLTRDFESLRTTIVGTVLSVSSKHIYESTAATIISTMALATSIPFDNNDYANRSRVAGTIDILLNSFNSFLLDLDGLQSGSGGDLNDYIPNSKNILALNNLLNFTMSNLFAIGLEAKQERFFITTEETDVVSLAYILYGLDIVDDSTIDELIRNNNLGLNFALAIPIGTLIVYYI